MSETMLNVQPAELVQAYRLHLGGLVSGQFTHAVAEGQPARATPQAWLGYQLTQTTASVDTAFRGMNTMAREYYAKGGEEYTDVYDIVNRGTGKRRASFDEFDRLLRYEEEPEYRAVLHAGMDMHIWKRCLKVAKKADAMLAVELPMLELASSEEAKVAIRAGLDSQIWLRARVLAGKKGVKSFYVDKMSHNASTKAIGAMFRSALRNEEWSTVNTMPLNVEFDDIFANWNAASGRQSTHPVINRLLGRSTQLPKPQ